MLTLLLVMKDTTNNTNDIAQELLSQELDIFS